MPVFRECANFEMCRDIDSLGTKNKTELNGLDCEGCQTYSIYKKGFEDGVKAICEKLNSKIEKPKSEKCPCDTCQTAIDRCGCQMHLCSDYQEWKEGDGNESDLGH